MYSEPGILKFFYDVGALSGSSTNTLAIFQYTGTEWSSASITNQIIDPINNTVFGELLHLSTYALCTSKDITPPGQITSLAVVDPILPVKLRWIAPGDDNYSGTAASYDFKISTSGFLVTEQAYDSAESLGTFAALLSPLPGNNLQELLITGLVAGRLYYIAVRTLDEAGNKSAISNTILVLPKQNVSSTQINGQPAVFADKSATRC